jgi:hypothetical protein
MLESPDSFGKYYVEILDDEILLERINSEWKKKPIFFSAAWFDVEYSKGSIVEPNDYLIPPLDLEIYQKPQEFYKDKERRLALKCRLDGRRKDDDYFWLNINPNGVLSKVQTL